MALQSGEKAVVRVSVATLWAQPEAVRPIDAPALAHQTDIRGWVSGMDAEQQVRECVLSQLLLGERVLVEEVRPDGWARIVAVEQPAASLDPRGYPGWLPVDHLAAEPPTATTEQPLVVDAITTDLRSAPDGEILLPGIILGTRLTAAGPAHDGWRPVQAPGYDHPLWVLDDHLAPAPTERPTPQEALAIATRLLDVAYIWGGVSAYGIDCSGLVHLAWRRFGLTLPRDADDQAQATTPVPLGDERPGDLYFFSRPGRPIHHIGIVTAEARSAEDRRMLHACYTKRRVLEEPMSAERAATLIGVHRVS